MLIKKLLFEPKTLDRLARNRGATTTPVPVIWIMSGEPNRGLAIDLVFWT